MKSHIFSIGLNDKDTKKQIYTQKQAQTRIINTLTKHNIITGYTLTTAKGGYKHADGTFVSENSLILELYDKLPKKFIKQLIADIKSQDCMNQESVLYTQRRTKGVFI